jgi:hypothetical protein
LVKIIANTWTTLAGSSLSFRNHESGDMTAAEVTSLYAELENLNIKIWVDGGWSVDALLGVAYLPRVSRSARTGFKFIPEEKGFRA